MSASPPLDNTERRGSIVAAFVLVTLIWGTTWFVIKGQLGVVPPSWSVAYRFAIGAAVMFGVAAWQRQPLHMPRADWGFVAAFGIAQFTLNFNFVYRAEQHVTSGLVAVIFALLFVPNAIFSRMFLGQKLESRFLAGSAIAVAGIGLLFLQEIRTATTGGTALWTGLGLTLAGVISASLSNVMQATERARRQSMPVMLAWGMAIGACVDALYAGVTTGLPPFDPRPGYWLGLLYLGAAASALAFTLYLWTIRALGAAKAAYSNVAIPIIAMAISTLAEGYVWTGLSVSGGALALIGMVVALRRPSAS